MVAPWLQDNGAGVVVIATTWPICVLATVILGLRFYARKLKKVPYAFDDYLMILGLLTAYGCCGCSTACVRYGIGKHIEHVSPYDQQQFYRVLYAYNQIYIATAPTIKISILFMYKRIFSTPRFKLIVNILSAFIFVWYLGQAINGVFGCKPINHYWNKSVPGKCEDLSNSELQYAVWNMSFDVIILALPVRMILKLQLSNAQKIAFIAIFLIGGLNTVAALCRLLDFIIHADDVDFTWTFYPGLIWTVVEPCVGVISGCLPLLRPVLLHLFPKGFHLSGPLSPLRRMTGPTHLPSIMSRKWAPERPPSISSRRHFARMDANEIPLENLTAVPLEQVVIDDSGDIRTGALNQGAKMSRETTVPSNRTDPSADSFDNYLYKT